MKKSHRTTHTNGSFGSGPTRGVQIRLPNISYVSILAVIVGGIAIVAVSSSVVTHVKTTLMALYGDTRYHPTDEQLAQDARIAEGKDATPETAPANVKKVEEIPVALPEVDDSPDGYVNETSIPEGEDVFTEQAAAAAMNEQTEEMEERIY